MADTYTSWDDVPGGPGETGWDDVPGGPLETRWDLLPEFVGRGFRVIWQGSSRMVEWLGRAREVLW